MHNLIQPPDTTHINGVPYKGQRKDWHSKQETSQSSIHHPPSPTPSFTPPTHPLSLSTLKQLTACQGEKGSMMSVRTS
jgi:hypothetical protein